MGSSWSGPDAHLLHSRFIQLLRSWRSGQGRPNTQSAIGFCRARRGHTHLGDWGAIHNDITPGGASQWHMPLLHRTSYLRLLPCVVPACRQWVCLYQCVHAPSRKEAPREKQPSFCPVPRRGVCRAYVLRDGSVARQCALKFGRAASRRSLAYPRRHLAVSVGRVVVLV